MHPPFDTEIAALLAAQRPETLLLIAPGDTAAAPGVAAYRAAGRQVAVTALRTGDAPAALQGLGRFDAALVAGGLETLDRAAGKGLLAALRDVHAGRVYAVISQAGGWTDEDMRALGFALVARGDAGGTPQCLYQFDIVAYKQTPDWLNPDHWANPQLWDKYRW